MIEERRITIRLPPDLHAQAVQEAKIQRRSLNALVQVALEELVRKTTGTVAGRG